MHLAGHLGYSLMTKLSNLCSIQKTHFPGKSVSQADRFFMHEDFYQTFPGDKFNVFGRNIQGFKYLQR